MKKIISLSIIALMTSVSALAQHEDAVLLKADTIRGAAYDELSKELTGEIVDNTKDPRAKYNWFVDASLGAGFYAAELNRVANGPLERVGIAAQATIGKWILPHWAVRFGLGVNKFHGNYYMFGEWNPFDQVDHSIAPSEAYADYYTDEVGQSWFKRKFTIVDGQIDLMYDVNRLFTKRKTPFDILAYAGIGYAFALKSQGIKVNKGYAFKAGIDVNYNITENFYIKGTLQGTICDESLDGQIGGLSGSTNRTVEGYMQAFLGVGINFGHKKLKQYSYAMPNTIERTYITDVKPLEEDYSAPFVVRFFIDQYNIESDQELNIAKVGKYLQDHPKARLSLTGHCDPETANPAYNQKLSERRCKSVLNYLDTHYGISHDRIDVKAMGDTQRNFDEDFRWNRCVILTILDK